MGKLSLERWYIQKVREAAAKEENLDIDNSTLDHALLVTEELLKHANDKVFILTDSFKEGFYKRLENSLKDFLKKGKKLYILSYNDLTNNSFLKALLKAFPNQIKVRQIKEQDKDKLFIEPQKRYLNFIINDRKGVRYELDEKFDQLTTSAIVNFGDEETHDLLKRVFNSFFERGKEVKIE